MDARGGAGRHRITVGWLFGFLCLMVLASVLLHWSEATRRVDALIHDTWARAERQTPPDDLVIVSIDPESLERLGRWPWPRELQARLLERIAEYGARGAVLDLLYVEPDPDPAADARLAEALGALPISILPVLVEGGAGRIVEERLPIPALSRVVSDLGHIVLPIDGDGIVRRVRLKGGFGQAHWPTLSLAALTAFEPDAPLLGGPLPGARPEPGDEGVGVWRGDHEILVPFIGPSGSFRQVSAASLITGETPREALAGRIAFVGLTSAGLGDVVPTPLSALGQPMPGVEVHASIFTALRSGSSITSAPPWSAPLLAFLLMPLALLVYSRAPPRWSLPSVVIGAVLPIVLSVVLYRYARVWFAPLSASVPLLISYLLWSRHRLEFVNRFLEREQARLVPHLPVRDTDDDAALAAFFTRASLHLPLIGWRFDSRGLRREGGAHLPLVRGEFAAGRWIERGGIWSKRYRTADNLAIDLAIDESHAARGLTGYVDSLVRLRLRGRRERSGGAVERLQDNAERLREQMNWLRGDKAFGEAILAGGPVGFVVWNAAGEWLRGNELAGRLLPGLGERAMLIDFVRAIGHDPGERGLPLPDERRTADRQRFDALLLEGTPWQTTHEAHGRVLIVTFSAVGNRLSRRMICASVNDVSRIRTAERARAEMVDYLSHDLQSPLVSALALLEEEDRGAAGHIRRSLAMMEDLLNVARADALDENGLSPLMLEDALDNALGDLLPQARARRIHLDADSADEALWVTGDATLLERAFGNLIGNAIKYSEEGSRVRVRLRREDESAVFEVDDEGIGIDTDVLSELFTRFRRDERVARRFKGNGLGLAFVAQVVAQHAGVVQAASAPGRGTRVTVRLPLEHGLDEAPRASDALGTTAGGRPAARQEEAPI